MDTRARDLMTTDVITVTPETPLRDVHRVIIEENVHGVPVVDIDGIVQGAISSLDLLRVEAEATPWAAPERTAADAMTRDVVTVHDDATVDDVARTMLAHHAHRVLVCDRGKLLGVISAFDLLRVAAPLPPSQRRAGSVRHTGYSR